MVYLWFPSSLTDGSSMVSAPVPRSAYFTSWAMLVLRLMTIRQKDSDHLGKDGPIRYLLWFKKHVYIYMDKL